MCILPRYIFILLHMCYIYCDVTQKKGNSNKYQITSESYDLIFNQGFFVRSFLQCNSVCRRTGSVHVIYSQEHRECVCDSPLFDCDSKRYSIAAYHSSGAPINIQEVFYGGNIKIVYNHLHRLIFTKIVFPEHTRQANLFFSADCYREIK